MEYIIGVDCGGTFTDVVVCTDTGEMYFGKSPTTPHDFSTGVLNTLAVTSQSMNISLQELLGNCVSFRHGTTVATNALITREGSRVGLITTRGFEDTTLIMRAIGRVAGLGEDEIKHQAVCVKPEPIVPRELIKGVTERIDFAGDVVIPLNVTEAREVIRELVENQRVEVLAVNLLFSFVNPTHEQKVKQMIHELYNGRVPVICASDLVPVVREYARSNTVIIDAFLNKRVRDYVGALTKKLKESGYRYPMLLMQTNGGTAHVDELSAVGTLGSGPAAGMLASKYIGDILGHTNIVTTDMGGTSFDVGLICDGRWSYMREPVVERFHITWPMIAVESIGAGGGSIAWIDPITKRLGVGPRSAAAAPGPMCYDAGGREPTVTDANLLLGYLNADYFLGGRMKLNRAKAEAGIRELIAKPLQMDVIEAAAGINEIVNSNMADIMRRQAVTAGHIPKEFVIYAFGSAGPTHAAAYGASLGVEKIYAFPGSGVFCAIGAAVADLVHTKMLSRRFMLPTDPEKLNATLAEMEKGLLQTALREGAEPEEVVFLRRLQMRYRRQLNELTVDIPTKKYTTEDISQIMNAFEQQYDKVYGEGSAYTQAGIEVISFIVDAVIHTPKPVFKTYPVGRSEPEPTALKGYREAFFTPPKRFVRTSVFDYTALQPGNVVAGPAIIETPTTTIVIPPDASSKMDSYRNIEISP